MVKESFLDKYFTTIISLMVAGILCLGVMTSASTVPRARTSSNTTSSRRQSKKAEQEQPEDVRVFDEGLRINEYSEDGYYSKPVKHDGREWM